MDIDCFVEFTAIRAVFISRRYIFNGGGKNNNDCFISAPVFWFFCIEVVI
jgi:hypothetical protein